MQAGQVMVGLLDVVDESLLLLNVTGMRVLRDKGCVSFSDDAGHIGDSFVGFFGNLSFVDGVSEGTQKDGSFSLAACGKDQRISLGKPNWRGPANLFPIDSPPSPIPLFLRIL